MHLAVSFVQILALDLLVWKRVSITVCGSESLLRNTQRPFLNDQPLRAAAFNFPPCLFAIERKPGNYSYSGICNDIISWLSERLQVKLIYVTSNDSDRIKFGIVPVLIKQLIDQEVDIIPFPFVITPPLLLQIDFSVPLTAEDYHLLQPWPKEESRLTAVIRPFSTIVWFLFLISTGSVIFFMATVTHFRHPRSSKTTSFMKAISDQAIYTMTVITGQGNYDSQRAGFPFRLVLGLWCLMMVVLVNAYTGTLMSYVAVPKLKPIVNTLAELAASHDTQMTVDFELGKARMFLVVLNIASKSLGFSYGNINYSIALLIQEATSGPKKIIGDSLRNNPQFLSKRGNLEALKNVLERGATYFTNRSQVKYFMAMDMKSHPKCRMTSSDPIPFIEYYSMGLPKSSRNNGIINHDLQYLKESGLFSNWLKKYTPNVDKCIIGKTKPISDRVTSLTFPDLLSAFALLAIGIGLSTFAFIIEIFLSLKFKQRICHVEDIGKNGNAKQLFSLNPISLNEL